MSKKIPNLNKLVIKVLEEKLDPVGKEDNDINNDGKVLSLFNSRDVLKSFSKESIMYVIFEDEPILYAYDKDLNKIENTLTLPKSTTYISYYAHQKSENFVRFAPSSRHGRTFYATWSDNEFLSDEDIKIEHEPKMITNDLISEGELLTIQFKSDLSRIS